MSARVILTPTTNSHPFQERTVLLDQSLKIGRSVARSRPGTNNGIFDCKVLSRNHALLWYEGGKFYLQDTKSSNGTFINNVRLSKSSEESPPTQIWSGDCLQFGVDVVEVNKKVTHGCIVANVGLFTPDGKESKPIQTPSNESTLQPSLQDIYTLRNYLRDASERERKLESKLQQMKQLLKNTEESVRSGWKLQIEEDRLLTRIDTLERQLLACHKSMSDDKLREEVIKLTEDKAKYQEASKKALRKLLNDKLQIINHSHDLQRMLETKDDENRLLIERSNELSKELENLALKYEDSGHHFEESIIKYKEEIDNLNQLLKNGQNLIQEKDNVIQDLQIQQENGNNESLTHNQDIVSQQQKISNESSSSSIDELYQLRDKISSVENDKKLILTRLNHLINLFEDLKRVSNKAGVSLFIKNLVGKIDVELRQIKNCSPIGGGENVFKIENISDNILISEDLSKDDKQNSNVEIGLKMEDGDNDVGLKELLEESRECVQSLRKENLILSNEIDSLKEENGKLLTKLKVDIYECEKNRELYNEIIHLKKESAAYEIKIRDLECQIELTSLNIKNQNDAFDEIKTENSYLHKLIDEQEKDLRQLKNQSLNSNGGSHYLSDLNISAGDHNLSFKLLEVEEELATFKDRYQITATECSRLTKKLMEAESNGQFYMQPGFLILMVGGLVVALLISVFASNFM